LKSAIEADGLHARLREPDDDDDLAGVLEIWEGDAEPPEGLDFDGVQLVNFPSRAPARRAIERAVGVPGSALRCVRLEDLVALKLYANGPKDRLDVLELLARNPDADRAAIRTVVEESGLGSRFDAVVSTAD
jgi:hypothetical protein